MLINHLTGDILQASDDLSHVINSYKKTVEGQTINGETEEAQETRSAVKKGKSSAQLQSEIYMSLNILVSSNNAVSYIFSVPVKVS